ncbi:PD-(D/E)XK nuclease family protein [Porphyromonas levii]|uniref:PD-(D/E)XK nuclease family protein n=1 Tax=Porphyromonas levii TaxID=28114 RepID=A0A4Y8WSG7_9PORP|nr:PD-(D/E)XK nuclease family protein [Porphyromonas levii]TFH97501.1 PD-(D/E)XK nuclease family protein [Porphyromonas levii]TFH97735.1 PD-(D/E)XK nuclease family protein [Porphyromonas levii]
MSRSYLEGLAELFYRTKGEELYKYRFFFQNKRAGTFFSHYLLKAARKNGKEQLLLPETTTLYNYLRRCRNLPEEDVNNDLLVIFHLYQIYKTYYPRTEEQGEYRFEQFYELGKQLLADFNDIDLHLAPTHQIFRNMDELGELTSNPSDYLSEEQIEALTRFVKIMKDGAKQFDREYSGFWAKVGYIYSELNLRLSQEGLTYTGRLMREVVEQKNPLGEDKVNVFVGLNGLSMSEQKVLRLFPEGTLFYWDYDSDLLQKSFTEKSRELLHKFPEPTGELEYQRTLDNSNANFRFISIPSRVAQSIYIDQEILGTIDWQEETNRAQLEDPQVAIILPDEGQLIPLLSNLSLEPEQVNITMGFPIKELPLINRILQLLSLQKRVYNRKNRWRGDELKVIVGLELTEEEISTAELLSDPKEYKYYFEVSEILTRLNVDTNSVRLLLGLEDKTLLDNTLALLFQIPTDSATDRDVLALVRDKLIQQRESLDRFVQGDEERTEINSFATQYDLITTTIKRLRIPFEGEPLRGIQIMGMLEARSIDFETVIIMDAGEGILPSKSRRIGLLPQSLRAGFGLPTYQWQDNIRAYNFFRLISRAKEVHALYDSRKSDRSSGEPSRYLTLLTHIYGREATHIEANLPINPVDNSTAEFTLDRAKIHAYQEELKLGGTKSLSPSSLIKYICCPRQFYFENILGLKREEEISEIPQRNEFGTSIHDTINQLYKDFEGKVVKTDTLKAITEEKVKEVLTTNFCNTLGLNPNNMEKSFVAHISAAAKIVCKQIEMDILQNASFEYIGGEVPVYAQLEYQPGKIISLFGKLDRVDKLGDMVRIIDYKTGGDKFDGDIETSFSSGNSKTFKVLLQLLTYCYMVLHPQDGKEIVKGVNASHLLPLMMKPREQLQDLFKNAKQEVSNYKELQELFEEKLKETVIQMMAPDCPFHTNNKKSNCKFCGGASICSDVKINNF